MYGASRSVETVFLEPIQRVVNEELADRPTLHTVEIERRTPRRLALRIEKLWRIQMQIIAFGSKVVVDDVEKHHELVRVRRVDQSLQIVTRPVACVRCERQHAVVTPVPAAGEIRHRHQLDRGHADLGEITEPLDRGRERPCMGERADVEFVDDRFFPGATAPRVIAPVEPERIDHHRCRVHVVGIGARGGIGDGDSAVDPEAVTSACGRIRCVGLEPAVGERGHFRFAPRIPLDKHQVDLSRRGRPQPEPCAPSRVDFRAERHGVPAFHCLLIVSSLPAHWPFIVHRDRESAGRANGLPRGRHCRRRTCHSARDHPRARCRAEPAIALRDIQAGETAPHRDER